MRKETSPSSWFLSSFSIDIRLPSEHAGQSLSLEGEDRGRVLIIHCEFQNSVLRLGLGWGLGSNWSRSEAVLIKTHSKNIFYIVNLCVCMIVLALTFSPKTYWAPTICQLILGSGDTTVNNTYKILLLWNFHLVEQTINRLSISHIQGKWDTKGEQMWKEASV